MGEILRLNNVTQKVNMPIYHQQTLCGFDALPYAYFQGYICRLKMIRCETSSSWLLCDGTGAYSTSVKTMVEVGANVAFSEHVCREGSEVARSFSIKREGFVKGLGHRVDCHQITPGSI